MASMYSQADRNRIAINLWTARVIPILLAGVVGYATYVVVALLAVNYLIVKHDDLGAAVPILVIYFILCLFMTTSFFRLVYVTAFDPPYVPLGPAVSGDRSPYKEKSRGEEGDGIAGDEYNPGGTSVNFYGTNNDPDSPGLELFYTKDVFVCEMDGKPKWCSECSNWKPDRTHHCSSSGRCIRKMDHFCPWVGGPIGENNFKFFLQFTGYTALYCFHILIVMAFYFHQQNKTEGEHVNNHFIATLALATFFGLFTAGMTGTSIDLAVKNQTQVEKLGAKTRIHILAVLKPSPAELVRLNPVMASQASYPEITYPLGSGMPPPPDRWLPSHGLPVAKVNSHTRQAEPISVPQSNAQNSEQSTALAAPPEGLMESSKAQEFLELPPPDLNSPTRIPTTPSGEVSSRARGEQLTQITAEIADRVELQPEIPARGVALRKEQLSARDLNATRTFAVLKMLEPGDSPWDLGQPLLNWQTVMGINMLDWFLPIRRSPCCNHEDSESQFQIGPAVDYLRARFSFISDADVRAKWGGERLERHDFDHLEAKNTQHSMANGKSTLRKKRRKHKRPENSPSPHQNEQPIKLTGMNGHASGTPQS